MSKTIKVTAIFLSWFLGLLLIVFYYGASRMPVEAGTHYGVIYIRVLSETNDWFVTIEGETEPVWLWSFPDNFVYKQLTISWQRWDSAEAAGIIELHLPNMHYTSNDGQGKLTQKLLTYWLIGKEKNPETTNDIGELMKLIQDASKGQLPKPNHHGHSFQNAYVDISMQHFDCGSRWPIQSFIKWTIFWIIAFLIVYLVRKRHLYLKRRYG